MRPILKSDLATVDKWRAWHGLQPINRRLYPPTGFIIDDVAAGFVTMTDTALALVENVITNPRAPVRERDEALKLIITKLERTAYDWGYDFIVGITENPKIGS